MSELATTSAANVFDKPANPGEDHTLIHSQATMKVKCVVGEYLRDLGLRDPDIIAKESQRIVADAWRQLPAHEAGDELSLCEAAIRLTVKQLERRFEAVTAQSGKAEAAERPGRVVATRLPVLLDRFPQPLNGKGLQVEILSSCQNELIPVVPPPRPHGMRRQALSLIPGSLKRLTQRIHKLVFRSAS